MSEISIFKPKTKLDKQVQTAVIVVLVALALWYIWQLFLKDDRWKKFANFLNPLNPDTSIGNPYTDSKWKEIECANDTQLKKWVKCSKVLELQAFFNERVASKGVLQPLAEDGKFGAETEYAVQLITGNISTTLGYFKNLINSNPSYW